MCIRDSTYRLHFILSSLLSSHTNSVVLHLHITVQNYRLQFTLRCIVLTQMEIATHTSSVVLLLHIHCTKLQTALYTQQTQLEVASHTSSVVLYLHITFQRYKLDFTFSSIILSQLEVASHTSSVVLHRTTHCTKLQTALYIQQYYINTTGRSKSHQLCGVTPAYHNTKLQPALYTQLYCINTTGSSKSQQ